ncbi:hypothetical protein [Pedobacter gandavensis]|uniref:hypothetical protein n=1 Tax=Pedobacter gandavensis TaxID=2679963 RepID=UPI00292E9989|nr:hypothetical protein [Pedobacter gandavensis]
MSYIYPIIKADYLQRTRSYSFLITLAITVFMAWSFIPAPDASYTTLSAAGYKGVYNSAWIGYVSGIMTTIMLSYCGFLLVNSGIKKDIDTEVGLIIATTPISNFKYLLSKQLSNYLVLLTIAGITFSISIVMFFIRGTGYPFILSNFILPYLFFAVPALFVVASLAVLGEVLLPKHSVLQFIAFFTLCGIFMGLINSKSDAETNGVFDPFGLSLITRSITHQINTNFGEDIKSVSFGFIFNGQRIYKPFVWEGLNWSGIFIASRLLWMGLGFSLVYISSLFFHRFDFRQALSTKKKKKEVLSLTVDKPLLNPIGLSKAALPALSFNYGIYPFVKIEFLLLIRQGKKWLWFLNGGLWVALFFVPLNMAHSYLLPILLFLQVSRWSELATKEKTNRVHYFAYAAYKPLQRMLPAQVLAGIILALGLGLPVIIRYALAADISAIIHIINGSIFIVLLAVALGILTGGKKLFEVLFFFLTYCVFNKLPVTDYLGSLPQENSNLFMFLILGVNVVLAIVSLMTRRYQARHL